MNGRINILLGFTFFFGSLAFFELSFGGSFFFSVITLAGLAAIGYMLWNHVRFKLVFDTLIIEQPFRSAFSLNLDELIGWRALSYHLRGQHRKTLILILHDKQNSFPPILIIRTSLKS